VFPTILETVTRLRRALVLAIPLIALSVPARLCAQAAPQTPPAPKAAPAANIFSGTITELTDDSITVVRKVIGREAVTRSFTRDAQTTVEGTLRLKARVAVRFRPVEDGTFAAVHIIVR
jgi:hypothetical protein